MQGASAPYGYPTSRGLKRTISDYADNETSKIFKNLKYSGFKRDEIQSFTIELRECGRLSVDAFLEGRSNYAEIGKLAITVALAEIENTNLLFRKGDWYEYIFNKMYHNYDSISNNNILFITFNYDRSLEMFLFNAIKRSSGKDDDTVSKLIEKISIIHPHGIIGDLPWQNKNTNRPYGKSDDYDEIRLSSEGIKIIHEVDVNQNYDFSYAKQLLKDAEKIYFLGFGYDEENVKRLGILNLDTSSKAVRGTCFNMTKLELNDTVRKFNDKISLENADRGMKVLDFLRNKISFNN